MDDIRRDIARYFPDAHVSPFYKIAVAFHSPGILFSIVYRVERFFFCHQSLVLRFIGYFLYPLYFIFTYYILDYHIEPRVKIGGGLFLHNRAIVIADNTVIGSNASLMGQVTIGTGFETNHHVIRIGDNVRVGTGARIIAKGALTIAHNVTIGANAVVVSDITKSGVYGGVPAKRIGEHH